MSIPQFVSDKSHTLHGVFEAQVERTPEAIALIFENEQLTYRELNERANQLADYLRSLNVAPEMLVGICLERSIEMIVGMLGILKAGAAFVPLDPSQPQERLAFILADTKVEVLLTLKKLVAGIIVPPSHLVCLDTEYDNLAAKSKNNPKSGVQSDNLAYIIYTSGSTGKPKGVMVNHQAICQGFLWMQEFFPITSQDRILQKMPLTFDFSFWELFWPLMTGTCVVLAQPGGEKDSAYLVKLIAQQEISILVFVPSVLQVFLSESGLKTCKNIRMVFTSGEPLTSALKARFFNKLPNCQLYDLFGATENIIVTYWPCHPEEKLSSFSQGRPFPNLSIYVVDEQLQLVPVGETGELLVGGWGLARGYLNRPELTAQKFISNPFKENSQERLYRTGDLVRYLGDGTIEIIGRIDNQVKIRSFRIELGEIEENLSKHPSVKQAAVIAREDIAGDKRLVAYVVLHSSEESESNSIRELRQFLQQQLPDYMIPSYFVTLESLPLTPNGKVDRRALPEPEFRPELELTFVAPRTPIEEMLANIWAEVLGLQQVGVHDNFFELGGHSLLATQVLTRIRDTLAVELPLHSLFEAPTVASLAQQVEITLYSGQSIQVPPLLPIPRSSDIPLSFAQARLWFLDQLQPNNAFYNIPITLRLCGQLNVAALESSLNEIIRRHEVLRTNFTKVLGQPVAVIASTRELKLLLVDLQNLPKSEREVEAQRLATTEAERPFNLEQEPLIRATLLKLDETEYVFLLTVHHIIFDGWSTGVFSRELAALYEAFCTGKPKVLPEFPIQYTDFAVWKRRWLTPEVLETQLNYWKQQLKDAPTLLELPTSRPRKAVQTFRGAHQSFTLSLELSKALAAYSKRTGVTLFMMLYAAFVTWLYRYTGSDDIVIGTPIANRNRREIEGLIGFFVNTLVLRTDLSGNPSFEQLLHRVRDVAIGAYAHQDLPFEQLVEALQPERSLSYTPLFQVMFALDDASMPSIELPDLTVSSYSVETGTAKFDLTLSMENTSNGLIGEWEYNTDLFDIDTIARMAGHFQILLEGIVANPIQPISQLPLLTERERHQLLVEWNNTTKDYPQDKCIHQLFEEQVERSPSSIAIVFEEEQLTYQALNARANQLAHYLLSLGVGAEVLVGICVERSIEMVVGILGILKAGGAYVPLDPNYPTERLAYILSDSGVSVLLTQQWLVDKLPKQEVQVVCLDTQWEIIAQHSEENIACGVNAENLAYVIYTSGSTGKPKGVTIQHRSLVNYTTAVSIEYEIEKCDCILQFSSISFDVSAEEIYTSLTSGATLVLRTESMLDSVEIFLQKCRDWEITVLALPTAYWHELAVFLSQEKIALPPSLRLVIIGGEKALPERVKTWCEYVGQRVRLVNNYGPTEATVGTTICKLSATNPASTEVPIGRPIRNVQTYVLDRYLQPVPIGIPGELYIGGAGLARGYLNRPDLTAQNFIKNPLSDNPQSRLYKTGDQVRYLSDGNIEFLDRIDNQVKIRGFRIELGEIEAVLGQHPLVREAAVIAREDVPGDKRLVAYVVPQPDVTLISTIERPNSDQNNHAKQFTQQLKDYLKSQLPDYMVPSAFVILDTLPLTPNSKVDRKSLSAPEFKSLMQKAEFVAPQTPTEELIASIWAKVLGVEPVGINDNFFELGGHSLLAIQLLSQVSDAYGVDLPLAQLFEAPTVASLANYIEAISWATQSWETSDTAVAQREEVEF